MIAIRLMRTAAARAITEPDSGSDAFGGMKSTVRRKGDGYVLNGQKTFITNGPHADTVVVYAKLDEGDGTDPRKRPMLCSVLDSGMPGLEQTKPLRKVGFHSSPTGELFFSDVYLEADRLLDAGRSSGDKAEDGRECAKANFLAEASTMNLFTTQAFDVAMKAVQIFGGNRYMAEYRVEQLARDAKSFMIYAGSSEVQVTHIAKDLLSQ